MADFIARGASFEVGLVSAPSQSSGALADPWAVVSELKRDPETGGMNPIAALVSLLNRKLS